MPRKERGRYGDGPKSPGGGRGGSGRKVSPDGGGKVSISKRAHEMAEEKRNRKRKEDAAMQRKYRQSKNRASAQQKRKKPSAIATFCSSLSRSKPQVHLSLPSCQLSATMLELSQKDLRRMKWQFDDIDVDESNEIDCKVAACSSCMSCVAVFSDAPHACWSSLFHAGVNMMRGVCRPRRRGHTWLYLYVLVCANLGSL